MTRYHLAQANIAWMRAPIEHPSMESFRVQLAGINRLADESPGFVWRLQTEAGDATGLRAFEDERILFNMSVWDSVQALHAYTYVSAHAGVLRARRAWFDAPKGPGLVLWWILAGTLPTLEEGKAKLRLLAERGPSEQAFTFRRVFPPPARKPSRPPRSTRSSARASSARVERGARAKRGFVTRHPDAGRARRRPIRRARLTLRTERLRAARFAGARGVNRRVSGLTDLG